MSKIGTFYTFFSVIKQSGETLFQESLLIMKDAELRLLTAEGRSEEGDKGSSGWRNVVVLRDIFLKKKKNKMNRL